MEENHIQIIYCCSIAGLPAICGGVVMKKSRRKKAEGLYRDQKGMMVVEAVLTFTVFLMVVIAIIYMINIFIIHNKIQFAINSAAHEIASYSYLYQALGVRAGEQKLDQDGNPYTRPIDDTAAQVVDSINKIQGLYADVEDLNHSLQQLEVNGDAVKDAWEKGHKTLTDGEAAGESLGQSVTDVTNLFSDPKSLMTGIIYMGASAGRYSIKSAGATAAAGLVTKKYLKGQDRDADELLRGHGIEKGYAGLDFSGSTMFCDPHMQLIDIVVQYDIDLGFIRLILPKDSLHVVQRVTVPAWLDGDGQTCQP